MKMHTLTESHFLAVLVTKLLGCSSQHVNVGTVDLHLNKSRMIRIHHDSSGMDLPVPRRSQI